MRKRIGILLMIVGLALAAFAGLTVINVTRAAREAKPVIKQVQVVVAAQDIAQGSPITASMLETKPFPADFAPSEAVSSINDAVNRYSATNIVKGQIITRPLLSDTKQVGKLALSIPKGKVAFALPASDLLSGNGQIQPGDRVDILVTFFVKMTSIGPDGQTSDEERATTQTTLQDLEVLDVLGTGAGSDGGNAKSPAVVLLVDPQQAVTLKLAKDSDKAVIDLALRGSSDDHKQHETDGETEDSVIVKYKFRKPEPVK